MLKKMLCNLPKRCIAIKDRVGIEIQSEITSYLDPSSGTALLVENVFTSQNIKEMKSSKICK